MHSKISVGWLIEYVDIYTLENGLNSISLFGMQREKIKTFVEEIRMECLDKCDCSIHHIAVLAYFFYALDRIVKKYCVNRIIVNSCALGIIDICNGRVGKL